MQFQVPHCRATAGPFHAFYSPTCSWPLKLAYTPRITTAHSTQQVLITDHEWTDICHSPYANYFIAHHLATRTWHKVIPQAVAE